jgi:hypothetical protein
MTETTPPGEAGSYSIEELLTNAVQPFEPLTEDEFMSLVRSIDRHGLLDPIHITADRITGDGIHRLRALRKLGRERIVARDVVVHHDLTGRDGAIVIAVQVNIRRHLSGEQRAAHYRWLQREGWSQGRIAKENGIKRTAVTMLLTRYPDPEFVKPDTVIGVDGRLVSTAHIAEVTDAATEMREADKPKPKRIREHPPAGEKVRLEINRWFAEMTPDLAAWIVRDHDPTERESLATKVEAIIAGWRHVLDGLEPDGGDDAPFGAESAG